MPFVQAKCESCGAILTVDSNLKAANCTYCGSAYVVQDSINYYNSFTKVNSSAKCRSTILAINSANAKKNT